MEKFLALATLLACLLTMNAVSAKNYSAAEQRWQVNQLSEKTLKKLYQDKKLNS